MDTLKVFLTATGIILFSSVAVADDLVFFPDDVADSADAPTAAPAKPRRSTPPKKTARARKAVKPAPATSAADSEIETCKTCLDAIHHDSPHPMSLIQGLANDLAIPKDVKSQNGARMSCAQRRLLDGAIDYNRRHYPGRTRSGGDCGGGVGESILHAGFPFVHGPRTRGGQMRYAYLYMSFLPNFGFTRIPNVRSLDDVPDGAVLVFAGPCTPGHIRANCQPGRSAGESAGHVTISGERGYDKHHRSHRTYWTDGHTSQAAIDRRYLIGAFLPPGSNKGPCGAE